MASRDGWHGITPIQAVEALEPVVPKQKITSAQAKALLWERGVLRWKLDTTQLEIHERFHATPGRFFVLNCSRRLGKSYWLCTLAVEQALQHPGSSVKFCAPTAKAVRQIIRPLLRQILLDCPDHLRPKENKVDGNWDFPNGSNIVVAGADAGNADALRGQEAHLCLIDEAGFVADLEYVAKEILLPQTLTTNGRVVYASTPPRSTGHEFVRILYRAREGGYSVEKTIYDNPRLTKQKIEEYKLECGGEKTTAWRREYLAEVIGDSESLVVPEFHTEARLEIVGPWTRPAYCDKYVGLDIGMVDATAGVFGYWDFSEASLVVEDEFLLRGPTTKKIASTIREKELALWKDERPFIRVSDIDLRLQADLQAEHGITIVMAEKHDKESAVNALRLLVLNRKIRIAPKCVQLVRQLTEATWNAQRTSYEHETVPDDLGGEKRRGHYDLLDALVYLTRSVVRSKNPFPIGAGAPRSTHFSRNQTPQLSESLQEIKSWFDSPKGHGWAN